MGKVVPITDYDPRLNDIRLFMHCGQCLNERPADVSPRDWASLEVGFTEKGIQVWCKRHNINVLHVDFEDQKHPGCTDAILPESD